MEFDLNQQNLSQRVVDYVKEYLLFSGKYKSGQKVSERELAKSLGISRSPIREAFKELKEEGLLIVIPRKGAYVANLSKRDIYELYLVRYWVESKLYEVMVSKKGLTEEIYDEYVQKADELVTIAQSNIEYSEKVKEYSKKSLEFHIGLCSLARIETANKILSRLHNQLRLAMVLDLKFAGCFVKNANLHYQILDALKKGDAEEAKHYLSEDMELYINNA